MKSESSQDNLLLRLNQSIQKVIDKQIQDNEPPEVADAIQRLQKKGFTDDKIRAMIAKLVVKYFQDLIQKEFSYQNYREDLKKLPDLENKK